MALISAAELVACSLYNPERIKRSIKKRSHAYEATQGTGDFMYGPDSEIRDTKL